MEVGPSLDPVTPPGGFRDLAPQQPQQIPVVIGLQRQQRQGSGKGSPSPPAKPQAQTKPTGSELGPDRVPKCCWCSEPFFDTKYAHTSDRCPIRAYIPPR